MLWRNELRAREIRGKSRFRFCLGTVAWLQQLFGDIGVTDINSLQLLKRSVSVVSLIAQNGLLQAEDSKRCQKPA
mgnify:CR=1 FL=1|jgi:hypothetical protein